MIEYENVIWDYIRLLLNVKWFQITLKFTWWRNPLAITNLIFMHKKEDCHSSCWWLRSSCYDMIKKLSQLTSWKIFQSIIHKKNPQKKTMPSIISDHNIHKSHIHSHDTAIGYAFKVNLCITPHQELQASMNWDLKAILSCTCCIQQGGPKWNEGFFGT